MSLGFALFFYGYLFVKYIITMSDIRKHIVEILNEIQHNEPGSEINLKRRALRDMGYKFEGKRDIDGNTQYMFSKPVADFLSVVSFGHWKGNEVAALNFVGIDHKTGKQFADEIYAGPLNHQGFMGLLDLVKKEEKKRIDRYLGIGEPEAGKEKHPLVGKDYKSDDSDILAKMAKGYSMQFNENAVDEENERLVKCAVALNGLINFQDVIEFLNDRDVNYHGWRDLDMIIYYLKHNKEVGELGESLMVEWDE